MNGFSGLFVGIILGLVPGLHVNILAPFLDFGLLETSIFVVVAAVSANFFEFLRASIFSSPGEGEVLIVNPLKRLISEGRMLYGIKLLSLGGLAGALICCAFYPLLVFAIPFIYNVMRSYTGFILLAVCLHLILRDKNPKQALFCFVLSGGLGTLVFKFGMQNPLMPMLTGLFGLSSLVFIKNEVKKQMEKVACIIQKNELAKGSILGFLSAVFLSFVPSIGPSQASVISSEFEKEKKEEIFLVSLGSINTSDVFVSFITYYTLGKARLGILDSLGVDWNILPLILIAGLISSIISFFLITRLSSRIAGIFNRINFKLVKFLVIFVVSAVCIAIDGFLGLLVLVVSTLVGIYSEKKNVSKSHSMGCLIIPTLANFIG